MHRSSSSTRVSDEHFPAAATTKTGISRSSVEMDCLPTFDPQSEIGKKMAFRGRVSKNAVHFIPLVLIFCAVLLWLFSNPGPMSSRFHPGLLTK